VISASSRWMLLGDDQRIDMSSHMCSGAANPAVRGGRKKYTQTNAHVHAHTHACSTRARVGALPSCQNDGIRTPGLPERLPAQRHLSRAQTHRLMAEDTPAPIGDVRVPAPLADPRRPPVDTAGEDDGVLGGLGCLGAETPAGAPAAPAAGPATGCAAAAAAAVATASDGSWTRGDEGR
jgi:hypothetical protein